MVVLHPSPSSKGHTRLQEIFKQGHYQTRTATSPLTLHTLMLSTYLDNWRCYLRELGAWCLRKVLKTLTDFAPATDVFQGNQFLTVGLKHPSLQFQELQGLRDLESRPHVACTILKTTQSIIESIEACGRSLLKVHNAATPCQANGSGSVIGLENTSEMSTLDALRLKCEGYQRGAEVIQQRLNMVIGLVSVFMLAHKHRLTFVTGVRCTQPTKPADRQQDS